MPYKIVEHTADLRMKVTGKSLEELFKSALQAMAEIIRPDFKKLSQDKIKKRKISLAANDSTVLLINFLNEVLTQSNVNKEVYPNVAFTELIETRLMAEVRGVPVSEFYEDIKAVTFHEADVKKNERGEWETNILFDI